jgi:hypothetical protein
MNVVLHQAIGVHAKLEPPRALDEPFDVAETVLVVPKDRLLFVAPCNGVIHAASDFEPQRTGQASPPLITN